MARSYGVTNLQSYTSAPAVGLAGDNYYNSTEKLAYISDGTAWQPFGSVACLAANAIAHASGISSYTAPITMFPTSSSSGWPYSFAGGVITFKDPAGGGQRGLQINYDKATNDTSWRIWNGAAWLSWNKWTDAAHNHDATYINVTGDTMTGALVLAADPAALLEAATKQYVDNSINNIPKTDTAFWTYETSTVMADPGSGKLRTDGSGGGSTSMAIDPITSQGTDRTDLLSTLRTDDAIFIQEQANANNWVRYKVTATPTNNTGWFQIPISVVNAGGTEPAKNAALMVRFTYGTGGGGGGGGGLDQATADTLYVNVNGDTMTGPLILNADATNLMGAVTKQYADGKTTYVARNPSFEDDWYWWSNFWGDTEVASAINTNTLNVRTGAKSVEYANTAAASHLRRLQGNIIDVVPGQVWEIAIWAKASATGPTMSIAALSSPTSDVQFFNPGSILTDVLVNSAITTSWQRFSGRWVVPASTYFMRPVFTPVFPGIQSVWMDDAEVFEGPGTDEVVIQAGDPGAYYDLWVDTDEDYATVTFPYISVYRGGTAQTITASTNTTIVWDGVEEELDGFDWTSGANVVIPKAGIYHLEAVLAIDGGPTAGQMVHVSFYKNGTEDHTLRFAAATNMSPSAYVTSCDMRFAVSDTLALFCFLGTGGATTRVSANRRLRTMMSARWVRT